MIVEQVADRFNSTPPPQRKHARAQFRILRSRQESEGAQTKKHVLLLSSVRAAMRTRRTSIGAPAKQKSCDLDDSFDADQGVGDKENVDANIQSRTRGRRGLAVATKREKAQTAQGNEATDRASKRRKRAVATPEKPARPKETQGTPHSSKCPGTSQETPPAFTFTKGKQTFRKRKQLKEKHKSQQCDQKRIEGLVQYFKGLDDQKLKFAEAQ